MITDYLLLLFAVPLLAAGFAHFLQMTFEKGMIFRWYAYYIKYYFDFKPRKRRYIKSINVFRKIRNHKPYYYTKINYNLIPSKWYSFFYKPIGGCIYCNSIWIGFAFFPFTHLPVYLIIPFSGMVYVFVELLFSFITHK